MKNEDENLQKQFEGGDFSIEGLMRKLIGKFSMP